jgi:hypothetical protein
LRSRCYRAAFADRRYGEALVDVPEVPGGDPTPGGRLLTQAASVEATSAKTATLHNRDRARNGFAI